MTEATPAPTPTPTPAPSGDPTPTPTPAPAPGASALTAGSSPDWMAGLSEDLRGDATLAKYASLDDFAKGHLETKRLASSKAVPLPGDTDESRKAFAEAVRGQTVEAYDFGDVPDVLDSALVDGFRQFAFDTGLPPFMAKAAVDFYAGQMAAQIEKANADSLADVEAFKKEFGPQYDQKLAAVSKMIEAFTGSPLEIGEAELNRADMKLGSANLVKFMFALHDRIGDLAPAGEGGAPTGINAVAPEQADATFKARMQDAAWRQKAKTPGTPEHAESVYLQKMIVQHRVKQQCGG